MILNLKILYWRIIDFLFGLPVDPTPGNGYTHFLYQVFPPGGDETATDNWQQHDFSEDFSGSDDLSKEITVIVKNNPLDIHFSYDANEIWDDVFVLEPGDTPKQLPVTARSFQYKNHTPGANSTFTVIAWFKINE